MSGRPDLCIHGHFYQPPREDPWTGRIPVEAGAQPYPNFNAKITAECYRPNAELRNFARISFDLGPTLAGWLETEAPDVYESIQHQAHSELGAAAGNAMAQAYSHRILPLATRRDKLTQVRWGIADFVHRFGYPPRGMWLPETAVDRETLEVLADEGIDFTILAPWQAAIADIDVRRPYRLGQLVVRPRGRQGRRGALDRVIQHVPHGHGDRRSTRAVTRGNRAGTRTDR